MIVEHERPTAPAEAVRTPRSRHPITAFAARPLRPRLCSHGASLGAKPLWVLRTVSAVALREDEGGARRTSLAGERTLLAWWRTGLAAIAVALGVGRLLPQLAPDATHWPYLALGVAFSIYGIGLFVFGMMRMRSFERRIGIAEHRSPEDRLLAVFTGAGVILSLGALVVIVAQ